MKSNGRLLPKNLFFINKMLEHYFDCPHCWENQLKMIDSSISNQSFIEDCEVCCNPLEFNLTLSENELTSFSVNSIEQ
jgi:transcription elongation factor Elf1